MPGEALPRAAAHAFVVDLAEPALDGEDQRHLERVLRLRPGQVVTVSDGAGRWRPCVWRRGGELEPTGEVEAAPAPVPPITVAFALTKGDRPEWVVQKLTEVGVDVIAPFRAARSVVRWDRDKAATNAARWRRVAREAAMQSRRTRLPRIDDLASFDQVVGTLGPEAALAEAGGAPPSLDRPALLVGPEGGWERSELAAGPATVGLGPTTMRAETAAVAAGVLLCGLRAGIIRPL